MTIKEEVLPLELQAIDLDRHPKCPTIKGGNAEVSEDGFKESNTEAWRNKNLFFFFRIASQQASILIISCPVVAARCLFQCRQNIFMSV